MKKLNKVIAVAGATAAVLAPAVATSAPAFAASRNGTCSSGEFCYYYNSNEKGSVSDFTGSLGDYGTKQPSCYEFKGSGNGKGRCIKNDAASVWNRSNKTVRVYYNSNYGGAHQDFKPGAKGNLNSTIKNNNASHQFLGSGGGGATRDDYPYKGQGTGVDPWSFYKGQCTSFVAWRLNNRNHINFTNHYKGQHFGNANSWDNAARAAGISVTGTPHVGDVAQSNAGTYGHVAWVSAVGSTTVTVEEYNYLHSDRYDTRTVSKGSFNYIHFRRTDPRRRALAPTFPVDAGCRRGELPGPHRGP